MVAEQSPTRNDRAYWTDFMNQEAAFFLGTEVIAKMTGFPVLFAQCHRRGKGYYDIEFHELATPPYDKASHAITDRYVALSEMAIRADPASWLWSNRRWKRNRVAEEQAEATSAEAVKSTP
jgi:KDO2-lipid IV(A) lauroyltransferase